jgi:uncharacterized protein Yka (UPF0111/DUF47 family)
MIDLSDPKLREELCSKFIELDNETLARLLMYPESQPLHELAKEIRDFEKAKDYLYEKVILNLKNRLTTS